MNWEGECYLLSKRKFRENANIINVFTPDKGKIGGIAIEEIQEKLEIIYKFLINFLFLTILKMKIKLDTLKLN